MQLKWKQASCFIPIELLLVVVIVVNAMPVLISAIIMDACGTKLILKPQFACLGCTNNLKQLFNI